MKTLRRQIILVIVAMAVVTVGVGSLSVGDAHSIKSLKGRIVAVGIPGASAISPVGHFLPGGPIHDNPAFAAYTLPGRILDPARILVGSRSNFGAPRANSDQRDGSFLSIDPGTHEVLVIHRNFAAAGDQASTLGGHVQLYSAQSPAFLNGNNNPSAVTADFTGVSNPLGLSINNAFGRLWPANAPHGLRGIGTSTILDPSGLPLAGAPNPQAGGVFAGRPDPAPAGTGPARRAESRRRRDGLSGAVARRFPAGGLQRGAR